jgi:hypothetical protein
MVPIEKLKPAWFDHRTDVPKWISAGIGQIAIEWSVLERELEELIRLLLDADIQQVRILVNKLNARGRVMIASYLLEMHILQDKLTSAELNQFMKLGKNIDPDLQNKRDMVVHGLWAKHKGKWHVMRLRQTRKTPQLEPNLKRLSRAVLPQRQIVTADYLASIANEIVAGAREIDSFCQQIQAAFAPLKHKPPKYTRRRRDYRSRNKKTAP